MGVNVSDRDFVVPGQILGEQINCGLNCYRQGDVVFSQVSGIARVIDGSVRVLASQGSYIPKPDDVIIGLVEDVTSANWFIDIGQPFRTIIPSEEATRERNADLKSIYDVGDIVSAKIRFVDEVKTSILTRPWKLSDGAIVEVNPQRVSRVVGKKRSMLEMIKNKTGCKIVVGQNGWIWVKGDRQDTAIDAIKKVEAQAHTQGLTARINNILDEELSKE